MSVVTASSKTSQTIISTKSIPVVTVVACQQGLPGATTVNAAADVNIDAATLANGSVLVWNSGSQKFEAKTLIGENQAVDGGLF